MSYHCRECLHNGRIVNCASKGNMKSHLGTHHGMGPFRCSVAGCGYAGVRRESVEDHIEEARLGGSQQGGHAQAVWFRCGVMAAALQHESDLCRLPHTVAWPNQAAPAAAPVAAPPVASAAVAPSGNNSGTDEDEDEEMEEDEADDLDLSRPVSVHSILVDKMVDLVKKAMTIGCYYSDRIDDLDIPERTYNVIGSDGRRIEVDPAGMQLNASIIIRCAIEVLNTAAQALQDEDLQQDQIAEFATSTCKAISEIPVTLEWYSRMSPNAGNTEEDMEKLASMQKAIVDEFDVVGEDEDEMDEDGDDE